MSKREGRRAQNEKATPAVPFPAPLLQQATALHHQGRLQEAHACYSAILNQFPKHYDTLHFFGVLQCQLGNYTAGVESFNSALNVEPNAPEMHMNLGRAYKDIGQLPKALRSLDRAVSLRPQYPEALNERGIVLMAMGRVDKAVESYETALKFKPNFVQALYNKGNALAALKRREEALACYDAIMQVTGFPELFNNRGNVLTELHRYVHALACYEKALEMRPDFVDALFNRGHALLSSQRYEEALASYERVLAIKPTDPTTREVFDRTTERLQRFKNALVSFDSLRGVSQFYPHVLGGYLYASLACAQWDQYELKMTTMIQGVRSTDNCVDPLRFMAFSDSPLDQSACAQNWVAFKFSDRPQAIPRPLHYAHERIRVAYLSADFNRHPVAYSVADLFESHDRGKFEIFGISFGADDKSEIRARLEKSLDHFHDVMDKSSEDIARLIRDLEIDIAVDVMGHTNGARPEIFTYRPAPISINYLGYPGTTGLDCIDYLMADPFVIRKEDEQFYREKIIALPDCYLPCDTKCKIAEQTPTRASEGLPEAGFVFCCFSMHYKITPGIFDVWMRLLSQVEGSVLWLQGNNELAKKNLRLEAQGRGVDPERLVFAKKAPRFEDHLARHRLADLYLDTPLYNAHSTARDALWTGVPLITCSGRAFASRVAGSILHAAELPELATNNIGEYEVLAFTLATTPDLLKSYRDRLVERRQRLPLFDMDRYRRHMEQAYTTIMERHAKGGAPRSFAVSKIS